MKAVVVHNARSGSAIPPDLLAEKCAAAAIEVLEWIPIGPDLGGRLAPHVAAGRNIIAFGGDGTVSAVAGHVAESDATLVPIPGGTLNNFTKDLGIPQDVDEALARAVTAEPRMIDIASVNGLYFVNNSSIGLYSTTLRERRVLEPVHGKWSAALIASVKAFWRFKSYRVEIAGHEFVTPIIFVGNNRYPVQTPDGEFRRRALDEGVLSAFIVATGKRWGVFRIAMHLLIRGTLRKALDFEDHYGRELVIITRRDTVSVSHDGELTSIVPPLRYRIHPGALRVR